MTRLATIFEQTEKSRLNTCASHASALAEIKDFHVKLSEKVGEVEKVVVHLLDAQEECSKQVSNLAINVNSWREDDKRQTIEQRKEDTVKWKCQRASDLKKLSLIGATITVIFTTIWAVWGEDLKESIFPTERIVRKIAQSEIQEYIHNLHTHVPGK